MESALLLAALAVAGLWLYRRGKKDGSRKGFAAGRFGRRRK